jgi:hypothetical protein
MISRIISDGAQGVLHFLVIKNQQAQLARRIPNETKPDTWRGLQRSRLYGRWRLGQLGWKKHFLDVFWLYSGYDDYPTPITHQYLMIPRSVSLFSNWVDAVGRAEDGWHTGSWNLTWIVESSKCWRRLLHPNFEQNYYYFIPIYCITGYTTHCNSFKGLFSTSAVIFRDMLPMRSV